MAKKSQVLRDRKREILIKKRAEQRAELRKRLKDRKVSIADSSTSSIAIDSTRVSSSRAKRSRWEIERSTRSSSATATRAYSD